MFSHPLLLLFLLVSGHPLLLELILSFLLQVLLKLLYLFLDLFLTFPLYSRKVKGFQRVLARFLRLCFQLHIDVIFKLVRAMIFQGLEVWGKEVHQKFRVLFQTWLGHSVLGLYQGEIFKSERSSRTWHTVIPIRFDRWRRKLVLIIISEQVFILGLLFELRCLILDHVLVLVRIVYHLLILNISFSSCYCDFLTINCILNTINARCHRPYDILFSLFLLHNLLLLMLLNEHLLMV